MYCTRMAYLWKEHRRCKGRQLMTLLTIDDWTNIAKLLHKIPTCVNNLHAVISCVGIVRTRNNATLPQPQKCRREIMR